MTQQTSSRNPAWQRLSLVVMGAGVVSLAAAAILFILNFTGAVGDEGYSGPETSVAIPYDISKFLTPIPSPTAAPTPPSEAPIDTLAIPKFDVEAPLITLGVDPNGIMESPDGPTSVAWYDFSARPGFGSNAVFSGHVDYYNYGPAVFWHLKDLESNDIIEVRLQDGTVYKYGVVSREMVFAESAPIAEIVGDTAREVITLITCGGTFYQDAGEYDQRVIVRAERLFGEQGGSPSVDAAGQ
ncbi:MAG: class F sortase [Dehalococcoidia bacterium]